MASLLEYPVATDRSRGDRMVRCADGLLHYSGLTSCLTELLDIAAHRYAGREAVVDAAAGARLTYAQLWTSASRVAGGLLDRGVGIGDRVAIRLPNGAQWVQAFLGVLLAGGVPVPVHPGHPDATLRHILADSGSDPVLDGDLPAGTPFIDDGAALSDSALLFYTGGTTGLPKGVELSHENVLSTIEAVCRSWGADAEGVRHAVALPLSSAAVCVLQLLPALVSGGTVVVAAEFDAETLQHVIDVEGVERLSAPGWLCRELARVSAADTGSLRLLALDDELVSAATLDRLHRRFPAADIVSGWGMTETGGAGMVLRTGPVSGRLELPHGGMEFAVCGPEIDAGVGELWCRGPSVMRGYWGDPAGTARTTAGGWLHTGDVVRIGPAGDFRFVGRAADAVEIPRGVVYSREIEDALLDCPGVDEAVAVGVMTPRGPDLGVVVVPEPGVELRLDAVRDFLDAPLGHRLPRRLCASAAALPRGATGRVDRRSVRSWLENACTTTKGSADVG
ncbi:long-chain fatty acid--CoA ligase [Prescottella agglutinans]|uniref:Long-chain fatty acid--CoA ligase n=1 Tax=Prescottella agglutinans TaxID=1644129 RepID=A0A3S3AQF6_9NOCA|nr:class I adenylate-forming enzyme family protein [Prescottella agglutinans]RVW10389.1 long-chain fatty acid--CoA ligase [Prescottella agglutinans]